MPQKTVPQNFIQELGLEGLSPDKQIEFLNSMTRIVLKRVTLEVLKKLSDQERDEFEKIQAAGDAEKVTEFLRSKIKDYDKMVEKIVLDFKKDIKKDLKMFA